MAEVRFTCPGCQQELEVSDEYSGQVVECPTCETQMTVPEAPAPANPIHPAFQADEDTPSPLTAAEENANACPECGEAMEGNAVLCVHCGFHTQTGKKIDTSFE